MALKENPLVNTVKTSPLLSFLVATVYMINYRLVFSTVVETYPVNTKLKILLSLVGGLGTAVPRTNLAVLTVIAVLTGANVTFLSGSVGLNDFFIL